MPTYGVLGKYGSGKSNFGASKVIRGLIETDKPIVTTLALNVPALNEYVQKLCPDRDCRTLQRVLILNQEQMRKFWRYRGIKGFGEYGPEPIVLGACNDKQGNIYDPAWNQITDGGVLYHIDEAPRGFHPRLWSETGIECSDYIDQHRRCGDEIYLYARSSSKLDKQLRMALDSCITLDNWYQRAKGMFRAPRKIVARYYEECPPDRGDEPYKKEDMHIDPKGISGCYWTEKGVGVQGTVADMGRMAKGLHWAWSIAFTVVALIAVWFGIHFALRGSMAFITRKPSTYGTAVPDTNSVSVPVLKHAPRLFPDSVYGSSVTGGVPTNAPAVAGGPVPVPYCPKAFGWGRVAGVVALDTEDGVIEGRQLVISNRWLILDGIRFERGKRSETKRQVGL